MAATTRSAPVAPVVTGELQLEEALNTLIDRRGEIGGLSDRELSGYKGHLQKVRAKFEDEVAGLPDTILSDCTKCIQECHAVDPEKKLSMPNFRTSEEGPGKATAMIALFSFYQELNVAFDDRQKMDRNKRYPRIKSGIHEKIQSVEIEKEEKGKKETINPTNLLREALSKLIINRTAHKSIEEGKKAKLRKNLNIAKEILVRNMLSDKGLANASNEEITLATRIIIHSTQQNLTVPDLKEIEDQYPMAAASLANFYFQVNRLVTAANKTVGEEKNEEKQNDERKEERKGDEEKQHKENERSGAKKREDNDSVGALENQNVTPTAKIAEHFDRACKVLLVLKDDSGFAKAQTLYQHLKVMHTQFLKQLNRNNHSIQKLIDSAKEIADLITEIQHMKTRLEIEKRVDLYREKQISNFRYYGAKLASLVFTLGGIVAGFFLERLVVAVVASKMSIPALPFVDSCELSGMYAGGKLGNYIGVMFKSKYQLLVEKCMHLADDTTDGYVEGEKMKTVYNYGASIMRKLTG